MEGGRCDGFGLASHTPLPSSAWVLPTCCPCRQHVHECPPNAQVEALCQEKNIQLPADMMETAAKFGLRASVLSTYLAVSVRGL